MNRNETQAGSTPRHFPQRSVAVGRGQRKHRAAPARIPLQARSVGSGKPLEVNTGIIAWIILGLLAGVIAKALLPGDDPGGLIITTLIGIAGAFIGGLIVKALGFGDPIDEFFDFSTWLGAIAGAILLLLVYRALVGRGTRGRTAY